MSNMCKHDTHLPRASAPIVSADLAILAQIALTAPLSFSVKLMSACFCLFLYLNQMVIPGYSGVLLKFSWPKSHTHGKLCQAASIDADRTIQTPLIETSVAWCQCQRLYQLVTSRASVGTNMTIYISWTHEATLWLSGGPNRVKAGALGPSRGARTPQVTAGHRSDTGYEV